VYETNLRKENKTGLGNYSQFSVTFPVDIGVDFNVSRRVTLRAATSLHYSLTDLIDDKSSKSTNDKYKGKNSFNMFTFTYLSLNADIFSSGKTKVIDLLSINVDYDMTLYEDEDNDGVFDLNDICPGTSSKAVVDTLGCPIDSDLDGIPDYLDKEKNTRQGAIVDDNGVEISEEAFLEKIGNMDAIRRNEVIAFLMMQKAQNRRPVTGMPIPDKFKKVDTNNDKYISFDELMKAMNDFFDDKSSFSPKDLEELRNFFFEQ
jgi:hypothetical protein